jgi:hypothetical protein
MLFTSCMTGSRRTRVRRSVTPRSIGALSRSGREWMQIKPGMVRIGAAVARTVSSVSFLSTSAIVSPRHRPRRVCVLHTTIAELVQRSKRFHTPRRRASCGASGDRPLVVLTAGRRTAGELRAMDVTPAQARACKRRHADCEGQATWSTRGRQARPRCLFYIQFDRPVLMKWCANCTAARPVGVTR